MARLGPEGRERIEADVEGVADDLQVGGGGEALGEEAAGFVLGSSVVGPITGRN